MPTRPRRQPSPPAGLRRTADLLHSAAIRLLRRVRAEDAAAGLGAPSLSALSVVVFGGPLTLGALAQAEQVRPPTITRLVDELRRKRLVGVVPDRKDRRVRYVRATARGRRLLVAGRGRRVSRLARALTALPGRQRRLLARAAPALMDLAQRV